MNFIARKDCFFYFFGNQTGGGNLSVKILIFRKGRGWLQCNWVCILVLDFVWVVGFVFCFGTVRGNWSVKILIFKNCCGLVWLFSRGLFFIWIYWWSRGYGFGFSSWAIRGLWIVCIHLGFFIFLLSFLILFFIWSFVMVWF